MLKGTITADGRLFLPKPLLRSMNITGSTKVIITTKGDDIVISKATSCCALCLKSDNMIEGVPVCRECAEKVADLLKLV